MFKRVAILDVLVLSLLYTVRACRCRGHSRAGFILAARVLEFLFPEPGDVETLRGNRKPGGDRVASPPAADTPKRMRR